MNKLCMVGRAVVAACCLVGLFASVGMDARSASTSTAGEANPRSCEVLTSLTLENTTIVSAKVVAP
jgi:hypothetical protein